MIKLTSVRGSVRDSVWYNSVFDSVRKIDCNSVWGCVMYSVRDSVMNKSGEND